MPTRPATPPRYGHASLAEVVPTVVAGLLGATARADVTGGGAARPGAVAEILADLPPRVVLLVVDGLGAALLAEHARAAPTVSALPGGTIDAVFPSTTVSSLASIGTGAPPAQHGLVGYAWPLADHEQPLSGLSWRIGLRGGGSDARSVVVPEQLQPAPTALEVAAAADVAVTTVLRSEFLDSGLTRAALRGGQRVAADGLGAVLHRAVEEVCRADGPALAYAHHGDVDTAGHQHGPHSSEVTDAVADVDRALAPLLDSLPSDVAVVVTADHGMVEVPDEAFVELSDRPDLLDGVRVLAGEPRARHLALDAGADRAAIARRWAATLGDRAEVLTREQALPLFGPTPTRRAHDAIGDLVVIDHGGGLVHERVDPHGGRLRGHHGGSSDAERLVPLRRLVADR